MILKIIVDFGRPLLYYGFMGLILFLIIIFLVGTILMDVSNLDTPSPCKKHSWKMVWNDKTKKMTLVCSECNIKPGDNLSE